MFSLFDLDFARRVKFMFCFDLGNKFLNGETEADMLPKYLFSEISALDFNMIR